MSNRFVDLEGLLKIGFSLVAGLHMSLNELHELDYADILFLNNEYGKMLAKENQVLSR